MGRLMLPFLLMAGFGFVSCFYHRCPSKEDLSPCMCKMADGKVMLQCIRVTQRDVEHAFSLLTMYAIDEITIRHVNDLDLKSNLFRGVIVHNVNVINSNIQTLSLFKTFRGLNEYLESVKVINSSTKKFELSSGSQFLHLETLSFESVDINGVFSDLLDLLPKYLKKFVATGHANFGLEVLTDKGFSRFTLITELDLSRNRIINIQRSMFPNPAKRLKILNLGYNRISYLPEDIFKDMPRLEFLHLNHNPLISMNWAVFSPIWNQLLFADLYGIPLSCDCNLVWMIRFRKPTAFKSPRCKKGTEEPIITDLSITDLCP